LEEQLNSNKAISIARKSLEPICSKSKGFVGLKIDKPYSQCQQTDWYVRKLWLIIMVIMVTVLMMPELCHSYNCPNNKRVYVPKIWCWYRKNP